MSKRFEPFSSASSSENISRSKRFASSVPRRLADGSGAISSTSSSRFSSSIAFQASGFAIFLDRATMLADDEVVEVQAR